MIANIINFRKTFDFDLHSGFHIAESVVNPKIVMLYGRFVMAYSIMCLPLNIYQQDELAQTERYDQYNNIPIKVSLT